MGVVGAAIKGFGRALAVAKRNKASADMFKKNKIVSKKTKDLSKLDLVKKEGKILKAKARAVTKMAKDVKDKPELFTAGSAFKKGVGKFGFNKPSGKK
jgi:hypothetical protein